MFLARRLLLRVATHIARPSDVAQAGVLLRMEGMTVEQARRSRNSSARVRLGREALLDDSANTRLQSVREVLCEPTRSQIVRVLSGGPLTVTDLATILNRSKSATSQHLRVLRDGGVVANRRRGRAVIYSLVPAPMVDAAVNILNTAATASAA
jgi:DNA-binding transcriptional ArsR family regulator